MPHTNRDVAFSIHESKNWEQFLTDTRALIQRINTFPCDLVAICCDNSYYFAVAFFASVYAQKKVVLPGNYQPAMLQSLSGEFDLLIDDGLVSQSTLESISKPSLSLPLTTNAPSDFIFHTLDLELVDIILFTSGSTGTPKAIHKTLFMLDAEVQGLEARWGQLLSTSRIVSTVSHQHIYGLLFRILWPLCTGRAFASEDLIYPEQVIENAIPSLTLISSPALLKRLQNEGKTGNYCAVFSSGGPLSFDASTRCKTILNQRAIEVFGSTETGGIGFRQQHNEDEPWEFFAQVKAKLGKEDCLALTSPWLGEDYEHYYQTSDQCELLDNQRFRLQGRIDRIVKIEEKRISLVEVENHINALPWVVESAIVVITEKQRVSLGALLTLTPQGLQSLTQLGKGKFWIQLRQALRQWVDPMGIPRHFRLCEQIPMNKQGKRLHQEIMELFK